MVDATEILRSMFDLASYYDLHRLKHITHTYLEADNMIQARHGLVESGKVCTV